MRLWEFAAKNIDVSMYLSVSWRHHFNFKSGDWVSSILNSRWCIWALVSLYTRIDLRSHKPKQNLEICGMKQVAKQHLWLIELNLMNLILSVDESIINLWFKPTNAQLRMYGMFWSTTSRFSSNLYIKIY